jgi:hypothetical protein
MAVYNAPTAVPDVVIVRFLHTGRRTLTLPTQRG